jgi:asparagine synthase (glutamine-hydrolysing)
MCGFAGFHSPREFSAIADTVVRAMAERLRPRGPDDSGEWTKPTLGIALGFRRLAIVELSELGHQPMVSASGRFVLAMNGEVYNHRALRKELEQKGVHLRGASDTEVLLEAISTWGLEASLRRCIGMFALAVVDVQERRLFLARDRLGEKPLYYGWSNQHFFFGSELKAFRPHPGFTPEVDRGALTLYLRYGYVPSPHCILAGFHKVMPGHILSLALDGGARPGQEQIKAYWSLPRPGEKAPYAGSPEECVDGLEDLLKDSIAMQMLADVPVGAFLSGGIDSSTVVSMMQSQARVPVKTFSIGFPDAPQDESGYAEGVAKHLGTDHITWQCADSELLELAAQIPHAYSEPFADDSQLPTMALARIARQHVTVSLSGDGGDELFHGYGHYERCLHRWRQLERHPGVGKGLRSGINTLSAVVRLLKDCPLKRRWKSKLGKARAQWLPKHLAAYYRHRNSMNKGPDLYLSQPETVREFFDEAGEMAAFSSDTAWLSYLDLNVYLPDDILVKVDRAAMAFSLETRIPLLDHRIVEYSAQIPDAVKCRGGKTKWPLRQILQRRVPVNLTDRPKMGFSTPMDRWLRGPLRDWAETHLAEERLRREGFFDTRELRGLWNEHQQGRRERGYMLWGFLMFQAWFAAF